MADDWVEFPAGVDLFRTRRLCAYEQWALLEKLRPVLPALQGIDGGLQRDGGGLHDMVSALVPLMSSDEADVRAVFERCLAACEKYDDARWISIEDMPPLVVLMAVVATTVAVNFTVLFAMARPNFEPSPYDGPDYNPVVMPDGESWVFRPVLRGLCRIESLYDGTLRVEHLAKLNDAISVEEENQQRMRAALEKKVVAVDLREYQPNVEEMIRAAVAGLLKDVRTALPASVTVDSTDGHVAMAQPTIKRQITNADGTITFEDHPEHPDLPIHHLGGGSVVTTHPTAKGDSGLIIYAARNIDAWFQSGGLQQPMDDRAHSLADGVFLSGIRATPDKLAQVSQASAQTRTVDKRSVIDHGPEGTHHKTVDPSTPAASADFDPFTSATKFFERIIHPTNGHAANATDGGTTHSTTLTHADGFTAAANNGAHSVKAHPSDGVAIASTVAHTIEAPNASLDKSGDLSHQGSHTAMGSITSTSGNISAPAGGISGLTGGFGSLTGLGGAAISLLKAVATSFTSMSAGTAQVEGALGAATVQTVERFTVDRLMSEMPASDALVGTRAYVIDAASPTFNQPLTGGGSQGCGALCVGTSSDGSASGFMWVAG